MVFRRLMGLALCAGCAAEGLEPLPFQEGAQQVHPPCRAVLEADPNAPSGLYSLPVSDEAPTNVAFCNMDERGGGWTLVSKIFRSPQEAFRNEPSAFWQVGVREEALDNPSVAPSSTSFGLGIASLSAQVVPVDSNALLWLELVHANEAVPNESWFKSVRSAQNFQTLFAEEPEQEGTRVCRDAEGTIGCVEDARIVADGPIFFEEMGLQPGSSLYIEADAYDSDRSVDGICAAGWVPSGNDGQCGHGMRVWVR